MAGATMGTGAFLFATNFSDRGLSAIGLLAPGPFLMCMTVRVFQEVRYRYKTGSWTKPKGSRLVEPNGQLAWKNLIPVSINTICNGGYLAIMTIGWKFAEASGMN